MYYFKIIPISLIDRTLIYKNFSDIKIGNFVEITVRKKKIFGVVLSKITTLEITFDQNKILLVDKISSYILSPSHIKFIDYLSKHYFIELGMAYKISIGSILNLKENIKKNLIFQNKIYLNKAQLIKELKFSNKDFLILLKSN